MFLVQQYWDGTWEGRVIYGTQDEAQKFIDGHIADEIVWRKKTSARKYYEANDWFAVRRNWRIKEYTLGEFLNSEE